MSFHQVRMELLAAQSAGRRVQFSYAGVLRQGKVESVGEANVTLDLGVEQAPITSRQRSQVTRFKSFDMSKLEELAIAIA